MEKIFFQSSLPRSGSTLLQNILGQNADFYVTPTSGVLELIIGARGNYTESLEFKAQDLELMKKGFLSFCNGGLQSFFSAITNKKYVVDKSRGWGVHYDLLNLVYPNPKIICMVRDLRDVFSSMEMQFRKNQHLSSKLIDYGKLIGTNTVKRVNIWASTPPIGQAIERLKEIIDQNIDKNILFVRFEDLCLYPEIEMARIYEYLGVDNYTHDFDNIEQITWEDDSIYNIDHTIKNKLSLPQSQAKQILTPQVCDEIYQLYRWFFDRFNYKK
jgi:sulfotransferase